jgi:hypothetical protein
MSDATIRLEIWVGDDSASTGHEQVLSIDELRMLQPVIGEKTVDWLADNYIRWTSSNT